MVFPAVSEADSVVKVAEWQQTYYASDSGIQSGATTVRDDESSTEYSSSKKYTGSTIASAPTVPTNASAGGGGDTAAGGLESPTGEMFSKNSCGFTHSCVLVSLACFISYVIHLPSLSLSLFLLLTLCSLSMALVFARITELM